MKYTAYAIYSASKYLGKIEANSKEEAQEQAWGLDIYASLCHKCSNEVELGDAYEIQIDEVPE